MSRKFYFKARPSSVLEPRQGFTLTEVLIALSLTSLVFISAMTLFLHSARQYQDGTEHVLFIDQARAAEQEIAGHIQTARAISVTPGNPTSLNIVQPDLTQSRLYHVEGDTLEESVLIYDPNTSVGNDESIVSTHVSVIPGKPMFEVLLNTTNTTMISFYVGLRPPTDGSEAGVRKSYTGSIVYMTATPRNIVDFIQQ